MANSTVNVRKLRDDLAKAFMREHGCTEQDHRFGPHCSVHETSDWFKGYCMFAISEGNDKLLETLHLLGADSVSYSLDERA